MWYSKKENRIKHNIRTKLWNKTKEGKEYRKKYFKKWNTGNKLIDTREKSKLHMRNIRILCLEHYGGIPPACACCKEKEIKFLSIDHITGGGNLHRRNITKTGKGGNMSYWLKRNNFPEGFQVLCHNCNMAKGFYGFCPHTPC